MSAVMIIRTNAAQTRVPVKAAVVPLVPVNRKAVVVLRAMTDRPTVNAAVTVTAIATVMPRRGAPYPARRRRSAC